MGSGRKECGESKVRVGVAGVGYLGEHHVRIYNALPQCELVGLFDIDTARAQAIGARYGCPSFESLEALGAACDAVSVVVPTDRHRDVALSLLAKGCHLLIEKPICRSVGEAEEILAATQAHCCLVQVGHVEHFNPIMTFLEETVNDPRFITVDRLAPFTARGTEVGAVLDLMIHDIGIILQLVKAPIQQIEAAGVKVLTDSEDIANARIRFENGCIVNLNSSRVSLKKLRELRVFQPNVYLSLDFMNQKGHLLKKQGGRLHKEAIPIEKEEPLKLELAAFIDNVRKREEPKVGSHLGKSALEVAIQITEQIL